MRNPPGYVDAAPYHEQLLRVWRSTTFSVGALAEAAGVSNSTLRSIFDGKQGRIKASTADALDRFFEEVGATTNRP